MQEAVDPDLLSRAAHHRSINLKILYEHVYNAFPKYLKILKEQIKIFLIDNNNIFIL
jgi:hypothetical protein